VASFLGGQCRICFHFAEYCCACEVNKRSRNQIWQLAAWTLEGFSPQCFNSLETSSFIRAINVCANKHFRWPSTIEVDLKKELSMGHWHPSFLRVCPSVDWGLSLVLNSLTSRLQFFPNKREYKVSADHKQTHSRNRVYRPFTYIT
jgi:hypothetical protein